MYEATNRNEVGGSSRQHGGRRPRRGQGLADCQDETGMTVDSAFRHCSFPRGGGRSSRKVTLMMMMMNGSHGVVVWVTLLSGA